MSTRNQVVDSNKLKWAKVDSFGVDGDDGIFYGLEEIDSVGVESKPGSVSFLVEDSDETEINPKPNASKQDSRNKEKVPQIRTVMPPQNRKKVSGSTPRISATPLKVLGDWPELNPLILGALKQLNFSNPTQIQQECFPAVLAGDDVIGKAATGSGKTLAFGLPLIEAFLDVGGIKGFIIAPTRELAHQIRDHLNAIVKLAVPEKTVGVVALTGGLALQKQLRQLDQNPVAVVGTPGRLLEVLEQFSSTKQAQYQAIPCLVVDEADRLVQSNSFKELEKILDILGRGKRQTMVFSATFETELWSSLSRNKQARKLDIREILQEKLGLKRNAKLIDVDPKQAVQEKVVQSLIECPAKDKDLYLYYFVLMFKGRSIVFVNSIDAVKRIVPLLKELALNAFAVHSDMIQKQRLRSLERFRACDTGILIATDVAARGLDVPQVDHVVHYNLPRSADMYVHRSGRTARAGAQGVSVVLCEPKEAMGMKKLKNLLHATVKTLDVDFDLLERLRTRVKLAKMIADSNSNKMHAGKDDSWITRAANDLDLDLSDDEREKIMGKKRPTESAPDVQELRDELQSLLSRRIGRSHNYLSAGTLNLGRELLNNPDAMIPGKRTTTALEHLTTKKKRS